ncbi:hypothetical protein HZH68_006275 [Vespula germanica]|uniref:Uncharacterized protein n=1 Tax=Vespula germanica TaxID=30212 RepID=A0A834KD16_VESGE|nr:hypothetical protein HZH68_006275 [Vespula germanica]
MELPVSDSNPVLTLQGKCGRGRRVTEEFCVEKGEGRIKASKKLSFTDGSAIALSVTATAIFEVYRADVGPRAQLERKVRGSVCWWYPGPCNSRDSGYFYCEINQRHYCLLEATSTDSVCKPAAEAWNNIIHKKCLPYVTILRETMLAMASSLMVVLQVGKGLLGVGRL